MSARCDACTSTAVTRISITMAEGDVVDFTSCHRCEHKSYVSGGEPIALDRVKALAARKK
ncbi:MAG TPA: hypothetical protein VNQ77_18760 [Frankiaceae bacterium]|nr:hypothetical protein [Frankiaceae bacterium]